MGVIEAPVCGALLASMPNQRSKDRVQTSITIRKDLLEEARRWAQNDGRSFSNWLEQLIREKLGRGASPAGLLAESPSQPGESLPPATAEIDAEQRFTRVDGAAMRALCGFGEGDLLGKTASEAGLHGPDTDAAALAEIRNFIQDHAAFEARLTSYDAKGKTYLAHIRATPLEDGSGGFRTTVTRLPHGSATQGAWVIADG